MVAETVEQHIEELTAGQRLQAAREERDIERSEVARWLKLDEKFIKAIEEGDEDNLPEPVFIAGYIRSYAKLVDLSPDQLVREFTSSHTVASPQIEKLPESVPGRMGKIAESLPKRFSVAANSHPANVKWFVMISAAIFVVGVVSWITVFVEDGETEMAALEGQPVVTTLPSAPTSSPAPLVDEQESTASTSIASGSDSSRAQSVVGSSDATQSKLPTASERKINEAQPKRITVPLPLKKLERSDPGVVAVLGEEELTSLANLPKENIAVRFTADSWVDIRDATGKRLIRSLGVAGATKEVEGVAPFQVLIGYGPGVELTYNGERYDFSKFQGKQEVARFTLNPTDNKPTNSDSN
ncbi:RodZ domain-containing protein [Kaarinaea lacus]